MDSMPLNRTLKNRYGGQFMSCAFLCVFFVVVMCILPLFIFFGGGTKTMIVLKIWLKNVNTYIYDLDVLSTVPGATDLGLHQMDTDHSPCPSRGDKKHTKKIPTCHKAA